MTRGRQKARAGRPKRLVAQSVDAGPDKRPGGPRWSYPPGPPGSVLNTAASTRSASSAQMTSATARGSVVLIGLLRGASAARHPCRHHKSRQGFPNSVRRVSARAFRRHARSRMNTGRNGDTDRSGLAFPDVGAASSPISLSRRHGAAARSYVSPALRRSRRASAGSTRGTRTVLGCRDDRPSHLSRRNRVVKSRPGCRH